jgi:acyl carrier protein phosphodiesterase
MNFLSHYYFDRASNNPNITLGVVLPDLIKNAVKDANLHPQKNEFLFLGDINEEEILYGWKRHLKVDQIFHSSDFFMNKTAEIKDLIKPIIQNTPIRPSFLAHISLELLLDHLLITHNKINVNTFYSDLNAIDKSSLKNFLIHCKLNDIDAFFNFYEKFLSSKYLLSYQKIENISYALNRICMRLWPNTLSNIEMEQLTVQLDTYKQILAKSFMDIFDEIEPKLN